MSRDDDLIRDDTGRAEKERIAQLKRELRIAFAASEVSYLPLSSAEVIARNGALRPRDDGRVAHSFRRGA